MDGWVPKGGSLPPGDGAFERFLTAAIAAIITIMFSWRLLDDMNDDPHHPHPHPLSPEEDEEGRRRRATAYAALALASSRPPLPITDLDIDEGGNVDDDDNNPRTVSSRAAGPLSHDSGYLSRNRGAAGPRGSSSSSSSSSVDWDCSSVDMMKCFTSAPPVYLPTADNSRDTPPCGAPAYHHHHHHHTAPATADRDSQAETEPPGGRRSQSPMETLQGSDEEDDDHDLSQDSERGEELTMMRDGTTLLHWPPENTDDFYNVSGDSDDVQPRELDSDEELYCCSLLEPIIEEDSDDFLSSSADSDGHRHPPPLPTNPAPVFGRRFSDDRTGVRSPPVPVSEVGHLSKQSPQAVVEDVFNPTSPLIPDRGDHSSRQSPDADDSESDESVQTVIRRESVPSSLESSPLHGPTFTFSAPESPVCEKRLSSPKRYGGGSLSKQVDAGSRVYPAENMDEVLSYSVLETNHPERFREGGWDQGRRAGDAKTGRNYSEVDVNSSDDDDNDSTIDDIPCSGVVEGEGKGEASAPVAAVTPLCTTSLSTSQPQAPAVTTHIPHSTTSELSYPAPTQIDTSPREKTDTRPKSFTENNNYVVETDLDDFITRLKTDRESGSEDSNMDRRERRGGPYSEQSSAIGSFLTEFEDEPFARRRGRRDRSPQRDVVADKIERKEADRSYTQPVERKEVDRSYTRPNTHSTARDDTAKRGRPVNPYSLTTDLDEPRKGRADDTGRERPPKQTPHPPATDDSHSNIDTDQGDVSHLKRKADPVLVELEEEPFIRRRGGSGRRSTPVEPDRRHSAPTRTDDRKSLPLKTDVRFSTPAETDLTAPEKYDRRKSTPIETNNSQSQLETDIDGEEYHSDTRGRDTESDRDSSMTRGTDTMMMPLDEEPFARRPRSHVRSPREEHDLDRSRKSDTESRGSLNDSKNDSYRHSDRKRSSSGKVGTDTDSSFNRLDPDHDSDSSKRGRRDSDADVQSFHSARSETDLDKSAGKTSDKSIDSFLTELEEEPFARRIGRGRRRASPERARDRDKPPPPPQHAPHPVPSSQPVSCPSVARDTCHVLEESPSVSRPPEFSAREKAPSPPNTVMVPDSPTLSMPTAVLMTQTDTRITSTPQKPDLNREPREKLAVPESPTISMPAFLEAGPQARMSYSTTSRIGTSAVVREDPGDGPVLESLPPGPYSDAAESSAMERTPRGYTFTRCESESVRSERRIFLVDKPLAPDFETFINSVPFTSETYSQAEDDSSSDFDGYSSFVQNLHRPSRSGAELSAPLPLKSPAVEEGCILSGNLVSPPNADVFRFPQTHAQMPTVSSEAQNMCRSDSAELGSDSEKEKSSRAEASSGDVLDTSFDIDSTGVREKMETDFAFLQSGDAVRLPPTREDDSREPNDDEADDDKWEKSDPDDRRRRKRDRSVSRDSDRKRRKSEEQNDRSDNSPSTDDSRDRSDNLEGPEKPWDSKVTVDDDPEVRSDDVAAGDADDRSDEVRDRVSRQSKEDGENVPGRKDYPHRYMASERAVDTFTKPSGNDLPVQAQSTARLDEAPPILFFQPAALIHKDKKHTPVEPQPRYSPFRDTDRETRQLDPSPVRQEAAGFASFRKPEDRGETIFMPRWDSSPKGKDKPSFHEGSSKDSDVNKSDEVPKMTFGRSDTTDLDRRGYVGEMSPRTEVSPRMEMSPWREMSPRREASPEAEVSPQTNLVTETSAYPPSNQKPPLPKPRSISRPTPTPMPRSKSLGDNVGSPSITVTGDDEDVFHRQGSDTDSDDHPSLQDDDEEELLFKPKQSTPLATEEKRPRSLKEIRRNQKSARPMIAPFTLPDHIILPSRLKINASRRKFLSSENLDASPNTSLHEQFAAHKVAQQQTKERLYKSPNKRFTSPSFSSQDQLEKLHYMLNYSRQSESSFDRSRVDHLHEGCILTPEGRRSILDKTLSIDNLQVDLPKHLRKFGSVTSLVETDIDTGETLETSFFPETNLDIFDHLFQSHQPLQRSASMSDMVLNERRDDDLEDEHETRGRGLSLALPPSQTHKSTGKGRFAHRKHQKSKSLCTLETNLDEVGEDGEDAALRRVPSVHELRVTKSLQKLNVPDWFKQSSLSKSSSCLLKYGSNSTMNSFSFSPSLISSPCASTAPPAPNVVIKTRVVPPSNPRVLRSPHLFSSPASMSSSERKPLTTPVKLPSERLREKEKNKNLMPIPIVPFAQIRAMFEKKTKAREEKKEPSRVCEEKKVEENRETKPRLEKIPPLSKPTLPSISISTAEGEVRQEEGRPASAKRNLFEKPPVSPTRTSPPPVAPETFKTTASSPTSAQPQTVSRPVHRATNGVSDDALDGNSVSSTAAPRGETFPPSAGTGRPHPVTQKPPISPTSAEPKAWREAKDSARKNAPKDAGKDAQPKSPPKESKQQFSPSRSLRQFFGRSKDRSSEKKSEGGGGSLDSSFSSGDGVYEKEPRRLGVSDSPRKHTSTSPTSTSFERRSDLDSSFSSAEGQPFAADTSSRSLEGAPSRSSRTSQSSFPAPGGPRPAYVNSERPQPPFSRFAPLEDSPETSRSTTSKVSDGGEVGGAPKFPRRLPGEGTSFGGHASFSSENGEHVPEPASPSSRTDSATAVGEKKSVKETTV